MQTLEPGRYSPSRINEFNSCPKQWQLHRLKVVGIPRSRIFLDLGICIHESIAEYFKTIGSKPKPKQIEKIFMTIFEQHWERFSLDSDMRSRANRICRNFISFEQQRIKQWKTYLPTLIEERLSDSTYVTIVDFYSEPEKTLIDWKTGYKRDLTQADQIQGKVMEYLLEKHNYKVEKVLFVALQTNRVFEAVHVGDGIIESAVKKIKEAIRLGYFPKAGEYCKYCDVILDCQLEEQNLWIPVV